MRWINYLALAQGKYGHNSIHCQRAPPSQSRESGKKGSGSRHSDQRSAMPITLDDWIRCQFARQVAWERARNHLENGPFSTAIHRQKPCCIDLFYRGHSHFYVTRAWPRRQPCGTLGRQWTDSQTPRVSPLQKEQHRWPKPARKISRRRSPLASRKLPSTKARSRS